jgi:chaperonin cofactor prefoldin
MEIAAEVKQKAIDDIKDRIEQIAEELHKLQDQEDETSKEQIKLFQQQINDLTGQLLTIMSS